MLRQYADALKETLGVYRSELKNFDSMISTYEAQSRRLMFEKLVSGAAFSFLLFFARATSRLVPVSTKTFWGDRMRVVLPESGSVSIATAGFLEPELTGWI